MLRTFYVPTFLSAEDISGDQDPGLRALHFSWGGVRGWFGPRKGYSFIWMA